MTNAVMSTRRLHRDAPWWAALRASASRGPRRRPTTSSYARQGGGGGGGRVGSGTVASSDSGSGSGSDGVCGVENDSNDGSQRVCDSGSSIAQKAGRTSPTPPPSIHGLFPPAPYPQTVKLFPLAVTLGADFRLRDSLLSCQVRVRDALLGGTLHLDTESGEVGWRKEIPLRGLARGEDGRGAPPLLADACIVTAVRARYAPLLGDDVEGLGYRPSFALGLSSGGSRSLVPCRAGYDWRQQIRLADPVAIEARGNLRIPLPDSEFRWAAGEAETTMRMGEGDIHLTVGEVNAIFYLGRGGDEDGET